MGLAAGYAALDVPRCVPDKGWNKKCAQISPTPSGEARMARMRSPTFGSRLASGVRLPLEAQGGSQITTGSVLVAIVI